MGVLIVQERVLSDVDVGASGSLFSSFLRTKGLRRGVADQRLTASVCPSQHRIGLMQSLLNKSGLADAV